jgi:hypothetical protein
MPRGTSPQHAEFPRGKDISSATAFSHREDNDIITPIFTDIRDN